MAQPTTRFSKPSKDVALEFEAFMAQEEALLEMVRRTSAKLATRPLRGACLLCGAALDERSAFTHRTMPFHACNDCGHVQSAHKPDAAFEADVAAAFGYDKVYPRLDRAAYRSRMERIYLPKARWAFESLAATDPAARFWCDLGCGAGYFLEALRTLGCKTITGYDIDRHNLVTADEVLGSGIVNLNDGSLADAIRRTDADIYSAFFVLEHIDKPQDVARALREKKPGTAFVFSVPVFGFVSLLENVLDDHYPRNLDGMLHTQMYTDSSIARFLDQAGFRIESEWIFGQDAMDLMRYITVHLKDKMPEALLKRTLSQVAGSVDGIQSAIDRARLADARHIVAVRR